MGTRHLIVIYYNGKYVLAQYGQWDGYPEGQGFQILKFLSKPGQITALKSNLHLLQVATPDELKAIDKECEQADSEEQQRLRRLVLVFEERALNRRYPSLSRDTSAKILNIIADAKDDKPILIKEVKEELEFAKDGLFCEWVYVIDLDTNELKVSGGGVAQFDVEAPQFFVEFDIEKLPGEKEFVSKIVNGMSEKNDEEGEKNSEKIKCQW